MRGFAAALVALTVAASRPARAEVTWYGWEILLADGASLALLTTKGAPALLGLVGYVLAGPAIHFANNDRVTALIDLGLRVGAPLVGGELAAANDPCLHGASCDAPGPTLFGVIAGMGAAAITDWAFLSWHVRPVVSSTRGAALLSLSGRF